MSTTASYDAPADENVSPPALSVVLNVMGRVELAAYGFRSWMLQDVDRPYEVVLNLFNDERPRFEGLMVGRSPQCRVTIREYERPAFFNISAANNLGLHAASAGYVMIATADMIYPSWSVRTVIRDVVDRGICYVVASRADMSPEQRDALRPPESYASADNFDPLDDIATGVFPPAWRWGTGWIMRRDAVRAVGGFDPNVVFAEDKDITDRLSHYLARAGLQATQHAISLCGVHVYHPTSELWNAEAQAMAILHPRLARLRADPASTEDVVPTRLDSRDALLDDLRQTQKPPAMVRYRDKPVKKIVRRVREAVRVLRGHR